MFSSSSENTNWTVKNPQLVSLGGCSNRDDPSRHRATRRPSSFTPSTPSSDLSLHFYDKASVTLSPAVFRGTHDPVPGPESRGGRPEETYLDIYRRVCTHVVQFSDQPQRNYEPERLMNDSAWKIQWLPCWALPK